MAKAKEVATVEYDARPRTTFRPPVHYPESDGAPMAETDIHIKLLIYLREALADHFRDDPDVYVVSNLFLYYREGDPTRVVAPDVFVVQGAPKRDRRVYQVWKEDKAPDVVFELTSRSTRQEDLGSKKGIYEMLGVEEYFIFDPFGEHLEPRLVGFRLAEWGYRRIEEEPLVSQVLQLELRMESSRGGSGRGLRLIDPTTGKKLLTPLEAQEARRQAEAEVERLRAELARLRASGEAKEKRE